MPKRIAAREHPGVILSPPSVAPFAADLLSRRTKESLLALLCYGLRGVRLQSLKCRFNSLPALPEIGPQVASFLDPPN